MQIWECDLPVSDRRLLGDCLWTAGLVPAVKW